MKMAANLHTWDAWKAIHQPFELNWWKDALAKSHSGLIANYEEAVKFIEPKGKVIDIGCGPRPVFKPCTVIEPLAMEYMQFVPKEWWEDVTVHPQPAEKLIPGLKGDTIIAWNALNHTVGWKTIIRNMVEYGNPGARFAISTDFDPPFVGHPGYERWDFMGEIESKFKTLKKSTDLGFALALLLETRQS